MDVPPTRDSTFFFSLWPLSAAGTKAGEEPVLDGRVTVPSGATASGSAEVTLPPSEFGYLWEEVPAPGYVAPEAGVLAPMSVCEAATGVVENTRAVGTIEVTKAVVGPTVGASATATVLVDCGPDAAYDEILSVTPGIPASTRPIPTGTTLHGVGARSAAGIRTRRRQPVAGARHGRADAGRGDGDEPEASRPADGDEGAGRRSGRVPSTTFSAHVDCEPGDDYDTDVAITVVPPATQQSSDPLAIPVGLSCGGDGTGDPHGVGAGRDRPRNGRPSARTRPR